MTEEQNSTEAHEDDAQSSTLHELAAAVRSGLPALPLPQAKLSAGWRTVILVMNMWAGLLFGVGLFACVMAMFSLGLGAPGFEVESGPGHWRVRGWGVAVVMAVVAFLMSKLQSRMTKRLKAKKLGRPSLGK